MEAHGNLRPRDVLADWLTKYGYDKRRATGEDHANLVYGLIARVDESGEWTRSWQLLADGFGNTLDDQTAVLTKAFGEVTDLYRQHRDEEDNAPFLLAFGTMVHAHAQIALGNEESGELWTDENIDQLGDVADELDPEMLTVLRAGAVPVRSATVVTLEGMACEMSLFAPGLDAPRVDVVEDWVNGDEDDRCQPEGAYTDALTKAFGFLLLIRGAIGRGLPPNVGGIMEYAQQCVKEDRPGSRSMLAFVLRLVASGLDSGAITTDGEDPDALPEPFGW